METMIPGIASAFVSPVPSSTSTRTTEAREPNAPKVPFVKKFVQFLIPSMPTIHIPEGTQEVILGIPGFLCTSAALNPGKEGLNQDGICYLDWGDAIDLGFTNRIVAHVGDYADALAQSFGAQISVHGNSLGGFLAYLVASNKPEDVKRLILTASPHLLTLDPEDLREHTNIAPFIGVMNSPLLSRFFNQEKITLWENYRKGVVEASLAVLQQQLDQIEILTFAATRDTTINGRMCLSKATSEWLAKLHDRVEGVDPNRPPTDTRTREFAINGDHVDVLRGAVPAIRYLATRDLHDPLPQEIEEGLAPLSEIAQLEKKSAKDVAWNFVRTSLPDGPSIDVGSALASIANAPISLARHLRPGRATDSLAPEATTPIALEPRAIAL